MHAAKVLFDKLPAQAFRLLSTDDNRSKANRTEFLHFATFFKIWDLFKEVEEALRTEGSFTTKGQKENWLDAYSVSFFFLSLLGGVVLWGWQMY